MVFYISCGKNPYFMLKFIASYGFITWRELNSGHRIIGNLTSLNNLLMNVNIVSLHLISCVFLLLIFKMKYVLGLWICLFCRHMTQNFPYFISQVSFGTPDEREREIPKTAEMLCELFPNKVKIHMPQVLKHGTVRLLVFCSK